MICICDKGCNSTSFTINNNCSRCTITCPSYSNISNNSDPEYDKRLREIKKRLDRKRKMRIIQLRRNIDVAKRRGREYHFYLAEMKGLEKELNEELIKEMEKVTKELRELNLRLNKNDKMFNGQVV